MPTQWGAVHIPAADDGQPRRPKRPEARAKTAPVKTPKAPAAPAKTVVPKTPAQRLENAPRLVKLAYYQKHAPKRRVTENAREFEQRRAAAIQTFLDVTAHKLYAALHKQKVESKRAKEEKRLPRRIKGLKEVDLPPISKAVASSKVRRKAPTKNARYVRNANGAIEATEHEFHWTDYEEGRLPVSAVACRNILHAINANKRRKQVPAGDEGGYWDVRVSKRAVALAVRELAGEMMDVLRSMLVAQKSSLFRDTDLLRALRNYVNFKRYPTRSALGFLLDHYAEIMSTADLERGEDRDRYFFNRFCSVSLLPLYMSDITSEPRASNPPKDSKCPYNFRYRVD